jgi:lambda family phage portal protein
VASLTSPDQELRMSLRQMRARCRNLVNNNGYAQRFIRAAQENVIGPNGFTMQADAEVADQENEMPGRRRPTQVNEALERAWNDWTKKRNAPEVSRQMSFTMALQLGLGSFLADGELFVRKIRGYANPHSFSLQFIDPDTLDENFNRLRSVDGQGQVTNEIRMSIEVDEWRAPVAYWVRQGHPSEFATQNRIRIPAADMIHLVLFQRINQTRGIPWMHAAMSDMHMLNEALYNEAVAGRLEASKMGFFTSKTGDEYTGPVNPATGKKQIEAAPGSLEELPEGMNFVPWDPQHPNGAWPEFSKLLLRGSAPG